MISTMTDQDTTVKVAVRIRPLNEYEAVQDALECMDVVPGRQQVCYLSLMLSFLVYGRNLVTWHVILQLSYLYVDSCRGQLILYV